MLLKYFYDEKLAQASYMVGCQAAGEAVIIDPARNIDPYVKEAAENGMKIIGALETHIHADFVSGGRELAERLGATLYVSDEGDEDWKYENIENLPHQLLKGGDKFSVGNLTFEVLHTPGHTPESISFTLTDGGANADEPIGIFTGDFVFVGDVGRPDLLEKAAGAQGTAQSGGYQMFASLQMFKELPDFMQVWPGHGAGSACGKALGAVPSSTVGYEKRFNWALQYTDKEAFVAALLDGQPEPPKYFAVMKKVNKIGPASLSNLPKAEELASISEMEQQIKAGHQVIDTRDAPEFAKGHVEGTINIPFNNSFANWAGWIVDYDRPLYLLAEKNELSEIEKTLHSVGIDQLVGYYDASKAVSESSLTQSYESITPMEAKNMIEQQKAQILDVRSLEEWNAGHIEGATHIMLGTLLDRIDEVPTKRPLIVQCGSGVRSAIAVSLLQSKGITNLYNLTGGYGKWKQDIQD
ncbi:MBL fold metallo-hydrolase [Priestia flexa]|uniref:MBL fold metallo-hydrolase n=1 Tax=Priestia flexa TaxID=86664 RepID=UPI000953F919|nr:MBL fold metallo-hydrolase [Priestia flexa]MBY6087283.1 MBL fold metallo-hydrolase [Priestia flexa]SIR25337.1 hydroxyacylglutathione hydrolase [Priestia flexa]